MNSNFGSDFSIIAIKSVDVFRDQNSLFNLVLLETFFSILSITEIYGYSCILWKDGSPLWRYKEKNYKTDVV